VELKLTDDGGVVLDDGKPVFVDDDGKDLPVDVPGLFAKVKELNGEAAKHRQARNDAAKALKAFEGLDAEKAREALETVANLDAKKLIDAGEVDKVKTEISKAYEEKLAQATSDLEAREARIRDLTIGNAFRTSEVMTKLTIPADIAEVYFGNRFVVEDGKPVGYDGENRIMSKSNPGEVAGFDEALGVMIDSYANRDAILRAGASGSGSKGGGQAGAKKLGDMTDAEKAEFIDQHGYEAFSKLAYQS